MGRAVLPGRTWKGRGEGGEAAPTLHPPHQQRVFMKGSTNIISRK